MKKDEGAGVRKGEGKEERRNERRKAGMQTGSTGKLRSMRLREETRFLKPKTLKVFI